MKVVVGIIQQCPEPGIAIYVVRLGISRNDGVIANDVLIDVKYSIREAQELADDVSAALCGNKPRFFKEYDQYTKEVKCPS